MNAPHRRVPVVILGLLLGFCVFSRGGYDIWAATTLTVLTLLFFAVWIIKGDLRVAFLAPLAGVFLVLYLSHTQAVNQSDSFQKVMDWSTALLFFTLALNILSSDESVTLLLKIIVPILLIEFGFLAFQEYRFLFKNWLVDPSGTLINANIAAGFHLLWVPALFDRFRKARPVSRPETFFWGGALGVAIINILLTNSVMAIICLVAGTPFFLGPDVLVDLYRKRRKFFLSLALAFVVVVCALVGYKIHQIYFLGHDLWGRTSTSRILWWRSGFKMVSDRPWLGMGPGNFSSAYLAYKVGVGKNTHFAHSFPVQLLAETGWLGLTMFGVFFGTWFTAVVRSNNLRERWPFILGSLMLLVFSLVNISMDYLVNLVGFALFLGIATPFSQIRTFKIKRWVTAVLIGLVILILPDIISPFIASQNIAFGFEKLKDDSQLDKALAAFNSAAELDSRSAPARRGSAEVHFRLFEKNQQKPDIEQAILLQGEAVKRDRLNGLAWWELARYQRAAGAPQEADAALARAAMLNQGNNALVPELEPWRTRK